MSPSTCSRWRLNSASARPSSSLPRGTRIFIGSTKWPLTIDLVVEVRPGGQAGIADVADHLALPDAGAGRDAGGEAGLVLNRR